MTLTDKFTIVGSIVTTLMFVAYLLVEYPKLTANMAAINASVMTAAANNPKIVRFITMAAFFGSYFIALLLFLIFLDKDYVFGKTEWVVWVGMILEAIYWAPKCRDIF